MLLFGNLWIAFMSAATVWQASLVLGLPVPNNLYALAFFATFGYYNLDRLVEQQPSGVLIQSRHIWIKKNARVLSFLSVAAAGCAAYLLYFMPFRAQVLMLLLVLIASLYSHAMPIGTKKWSLKQTGLLKPMLIAFVWVSISFLFIPIYHQNLSDTAGLLSLGYGFFITALCLPFDYRDRFIDRNNSMSIWGRAVSVSRVSQLIGLLLFGQLAIWAWVIPSDFLLFLIPYQCFVLFVCYKSMQIGKEWMYSFGIDGLILGQTLVFWMYLNDLFSN